MKRKIITLIIVMLFTVPVSTNAVSLADLNIQIAELLAQVFNLKAQLARVGTTTSAVDTSSTPAPPSDLSCLILNRDLAQGDRGFDVTNMQLFLARNSYIYPEALITGYFGRATERAVQRFQVSRGIVSYGTPGTTGYGVVGPRTRTLMRKSCPPPTVATTTATTTPTDGDVLIKPIEAVTIAGDTPFDVHIKFTLSDKCISYHVDWGDGTVPLAHDARDTPCSGTVKEVVMNHVYPRNGVYTVMLRAGKVVQYSQLQLALPVVSYKAVVAGGSVQPFSLSPSEGMAPLPVEAVFTLSHPSCSSYSIDWGDGKRDSFEPSSFTCSENVTTRRIKHIYSNPGTYDVFFRKGFARLTNLPVSEHWLVIAEALGKDSVIVEVSETSGRNPLTVSVKMITTYGDCTSYEIDWGDGTSTQRKENAVIITDEFSSASFVTGGGDFVGGDDSCQGSFNREFTHTYVIYGAYPLRVKLGKGELKDISAVQHWVSIFSQ